MRRIILAVLLCLASFGVSAQPFNVPAPFLMPGITVTTTAPATFWTLVNHVLITPGTGFSPLVSSPISTTGATIIVIAVEWYSGAAGSPFLSDSLANTWTKLTTITGANSAVVLYYSLNPTVGASHTFTLSSTGGNFFGGGQVEAFSGSATPGFTSGQQSGAAGTSGVSSNIQPGSITPATNNSLVVTALGTSWTGTSSVTSPFATPTDQMNTAASVGGAMSWYSQSTASALNPTWSTTGTAAANDENAVMAVFHP